MRVIGHLGSESYARTFADFLFVQGIENQVEFEEGSGWAVWIAEEDKLAQASTLIAAFRQDPAGAQFQSQAKAAAGMRAKLAEGQAAYQKRVRDRRHLFRPLRDYGFGVLTYALIAVSVVICILSNFGNDRERLQSLFISLLPPGPDPSGSALGLPEVLHGQIWRLLTPIFIHFGLMHLVFNMLWLRDLGGMIEGRQSTWRLALLVLVLGVCSNLAQY